LWSNLGTTCRLFTQKKSWICMHVPQLQPKGYHVIAGACGSDVFPLFMSEPTLLNGYEPNGGMMAMFSNRLSFFFDFQGPSYTVDTGVLPIFGDEHKNLCLHSPTIAGPQDHMHRYMPQPLAAWRPAWRNMDTHARAGTHTHPHTHTQKHTQCVKMMCIEPPSTHTHTLSCIGQMAETHTMTNSSSRDVHARDCGVQGGLLS
jgi:hypothetical protein